MERDYQSLITSGNTAQLEKLKANEHKRGFDNVDIEYAYFRLVDESEELANELYAVVSEKSRTLYFKKDQIDYRKIRHEAADIANFAHMIIHKCDQEISHG